MHFPKKMSNIRLRFVIDVFMPMYIYVYNISRPFLLKNEM